MATEYTSDTSVFPRSFLPADLDTSNFITITCVGDSMAKYLNTKTGEVHDSAVYFEQYCKEQCGG